MTPEEHKIYRTLPKSLKDLIAIGELECDIMTVRETKKEKENSPFSISDKTYELYARQEIDMTNRKNDLVRMYLGLGVTNNG